MILLFFANCLLLKIEERQKKTEKLFFTILCTLGIQFNFFIGANKNVIRIKTSKNFHFLFVLGDFLSFWDLMTGKSRDWGVFWRENRFNESFWKEIGTSGFFDRKLQSLGHFGGKMELLSKIKSKSIKITSITTTKPTKHPSILKSHQFFFDGNKKRQLNLTQCFFPHSPRFFIIHCVL